MRRQLAATAPAISLFPFLAVLLCTMGALVVVLVVLNRQSRLRAAAESAADAMALGRSAEEERAMAELRRDEIAWQLAHLRTSRDLTQEDLNQERLKLSGVEQHRRQLQSKLEELARAAKQLEALQQGSGQVEGQELAQIIAEIESAREELETARKRAAEAPPAYAVVPYEGPNRTNRRPIYIECIGDRVIIQPEGIVLQASDFEGPMGPGNAMASAIRAARDHIVAEAPDTKSQDAEPYPLFLVRPDGIEAYYAARAAMASWGSDFGYQTVEQDWQLAYPKADPRLAAVAQDAADEARERLRWLARLNGSQHSAAGHGRSGGGRASYRVSPLGGLIREGGPSLRDAAPSLSMRDGRNGVAGSGSLARGSAPGGLEKAVQGDGSTTGERIGHIGDGDRHPPNRGKTARGGLVKAEGIAEGATGETFASAGPSKRRYGDLNDRAAANRERSAAVEAQGSAETSHETGETHVNMQVNSKSKERPRSLAEKRGVNWGLSPAARSSNPITRPIHIVCEGDKLLIRPQQEGEPATEIPLSSRTEDSVDRLVGAVQKRIDEWGIAGRGLYWRPQLVLEVGRSGEGRYADLDALLADSGFDVKRR
jgi:hypothetical protein